MSRKFDEALERAADLAAEVRAGDGAKMAPAAFLRAALTNAGCDEERLDEVKRATAHPDFAEVHAFRRRLIAVMRTGTVPSVPAPDRMATFGRVYGPDADAAMGQAGTRASEIFALAARDHVRASPDRFGDVEDWAAFQARLDEARDELREALETLEGAYGADDLVIDQAAVTRGEAERGLARVSFRRASGVALGRDWPRRLVDAVLAERSRDEAA